MRKKEREKDMDKKEIKIENGSEKEWEREKWWKSVIVRDKTIANEWINNPNDNKQDYHYIIKALVIKVFNQSPMFPSSMDKEEQQNFTVSRITRIS